MRKLNQLFHPVFIIALLLLLFNDAYLKWHHPSWLTGKLSDFAGLFAFAFFFLTLFEKRKSAVLILSGLFFVWWKSPLSQFFIDSWNSQFPVMLGRVVDWTDLTALSVLLLLYVYRVKPVKYKASAFIQFGFLIIILSTFSATSIRRYSYPEGHVAIDNSFKIKKSEAAIFYMLDSLGFLYEKDSIISAYQRIDAWSTAYPADTLTRYAPDSLSYSTFYVLKNVKLNEHFFLEKIRFDIWEYEEGRKNKKHCLLRVHSIDFAEKPHHLDHWKKLRRLKKYYTKLIRKEIIKKLKE